MKKLMGASAQDFFERTISTYKSNRGDDDDDDPVAAANADIKARLNLHIDKMVRDSLGNVESIRLQIAEAEKKRVQDEVEELLAEEQRTTVMGQWA
jgi:hypothetical protein